jgi:hypothetical protein
MTKNNVLVVLALALAACSHEGTGGGGTAPGPRATSPAISELLAVVPGNAAAVGFVDLTQSPWSMITTGYLLPLDEATRKTLDQELHAYVDRYLGVDVSRLQYAVGFAAGPPPAFAVVVKTVEGEPRLPGAEAVEGGKLWRVDRDKGLSLALVNGIAVFGLDATVRDVLATQAGKRKPVTEDNKPLVDWLRGQSRGAVLAFAAVRPRGLPLPPPISGLERVAVSLGERGVSAVIDGDDATISTIQAELDKGFAKGLAELERKHAAALAGQGDPVEGVATIIAAAYAKSFVAQIRPKRTGNRLASSLELGGSATSSISLMSTMGILSAVAIPAFMDYTKRSRTTEPAPSSE